MRTLLLVCLLFGVACAFNTEIYEDMVNYMANTPVFQKDFSNNVNKLLNLEPHYFDYSHMQRLNYSFSCDTSSPSEPATSVHKLRPSDIQVIGALGDSLTAALGAKASTVLGLLVENRGASWSAGGEQALEQVLTVPNILRKYNPKVCGFNTESNTMSYGSKNEGVGFNAAISGNEANHIPRQARVLVDRLKASKEIDFQNDWKMITLFVGGNDLCDMCKNADLHTPEAYANYIEQALDILYNEVPRAFVNLAGVLNVGQVKQLNLGLVCDVLHLKTCPCAAYPIGSDAERLLQEYFQEYLRLSENLANSGKYDGREDFTVVYQPFFTKFDIPRLPNGDVDLSIFAPDCFHLSMKGHGVIATGLWNNLLQPVGQKSSSYAIDTQLNCPSKDFPYFYTNKNSK